MSNIKQKMSSDKGITIVALLIVISLMIILASISIGSSMDSIYEIKLKAFYSRLEILQKRIDEIVSTNESYIDTSGNTIDIKNAGIPYEDFSDESKKTLISILGQENLDIQPNGFRYFTIDDINTILDLEEIEYNVYIDFDNKIVLVADGVEINGQTYYRLDNDMYYPEYTEESKVTINYDSPFEYSIIKYGADSYKLTIIPNYNFEGDSPETIEIKYKKTSTKYWETSLKNEIVIKELADYDIEYKDSENNMVSRTIRISLENDDDLTVNEITEESN